MNSNIQAQHLPEDVWKHRGGQCHLKPSRDHTAVVHPHPHPLSQVHSLLPSSPVAGIVAIVAPETHLAGAPVGQVGGHSNQGQVGAVLVAAQLSDPVLTTQQPQH